MLAVCITEIHMFVSLVGRPADIEMDKALTVSHPAPCSLQASALLAMVAGNGVMSLEPPSGWQVYATCRDLNSASELRRLADVSDRTMQVLALDVTDLASVKAAATELDGQAIELLLNNAGIGGPPGQRVGNIDYEAWAKVLDVNILGPLRVSEAFVDNVARSKGKLIVIVTSGMDSIADNTSGGAFAYRSSKAAVNMLMRSLAVDLAPSGVTCVVINPGWVRTDMGGPHGTQTPAESIAKLRHLIEDLGRDQSGKFFNHDGREFAW